MDKKTIFLVLAMVLLAGVASSQMLNGVAYGYENTEKEASIVNQRILTLDDLKNLLSSDAKFKETHDYAKELGYLYPKEMAEMDFSDGSRITNIMLVSSDGKNLMLTKYSSKNYTTSMLLKSDEETNELLLFDKEGGIKIKANGEISNWATHSSCHPWFCTAKGLAWSGWGQGELANFAKETVELIPKCGACGLCAIPCKAGIASCVTIATCPAGIGICLTCLGSNPECLDCLASAGQNVKALWDKFWEVKGRCDDDPSVFSPYPGWQCKNTYPSGQYDYGCDGNTRIQKYCEDCEWKQNTFDCTINNQECGWSHSLGHFTCLDTCTTDADCNDNNPCTTQDWCIYNVCKHQGKNCNDGDKCTADSCDANGNCVHTKSPGCDHPDDAPLDVSLIGHKTDFNSVGSENNELGIKNSGFKASDSEDGYYAGTQEKVALLAAGYYTSAQSLLENLGEEVTLFNITFSSMLANEYPVLFISSGALQGLDSSLSFKANLSDYVSHGGTLIVMAQQNGRDFRALPGGVDGFGWAQDKSCNWASVFLNTYHPILSTLSSSTASVNVDGYFTTLPRNSTVLLRRTKNGMPSMVSYPYGNGTVVMSTAYSDWIYGRGASTEEVRFIRDTVTWAKDADKEIREYNTSDRINETINITISPLSPPDSAQFIPGNRVNLTLNLNNTGSISASSVVFSVYDPDYNYTNTSYALASSLGVNQTTDYAFFYNTTNNSAQGGWFILYTLYSGTTKVTGGYGGGFILTTDITQTSTYTINMTLRDPDKNIKKSIIETLLFSGNETTKPVNFNFSEGYMSTGIWTLEYTVFDRNGNLQDNNRRLISVSYYTRNPGGFSYRNTDLQIWGTLPNEYMPFGSDIPYTVTVNNNRDTNFTGHIAIGGHEDDGNWWMYYDALPNITVPANSQREFNWTKGNATFSTSIYFGLFDQNQAYENKWFHSGSIVTSEEGFWLIFPKASVTLETDRIAYSKGDTIYLTANVTNEAEAEFNYTITFDVHKDWSTKICSENVTVNVSSLGKTNVTVNCTIPSDSYGNYWFARATVGHDSYNLWSGWYFQATGWAYEYFSVPRPVVTITPPETSNMTFSKGSNAISFTIQNQGPGNLVGGTFNVSLQSPNGTMQWSSSQPIALLSANSSTQINFAMQVTGMEFGKYKLLYSLDYGENYALSGAKEISCENTLAFYPTASRFRVGDNVSTVVIVKNVGRFNESLILNVSMQFMNFSETAGFNLTPGSTYNYSMSSRRMPQIDSRKYNITAKLSSAEDPIEQNYEIFVTNEPVLSLVLGSDRYNAGENITYNISNSGNANATCYQLSFWSSWYTYYSETLNFTVPVSGQVSGNYSTSKALDDGQYNFIIYCRGENYWDYIPLSESINMSGLKLSLMLSDYEYNAGENVTIRLNNSGGISSSANCSLQLYRYWYSAIVTSSSIVNTTAGEVKSAHIEIPVTAETNTYGLTVTCTDIETGKSASLYEYVNVTGQDLTLSILGYNYSAGEEIEVLMDNTGGVDAIGNFTLSLSGTQSYTINLLNQEVLIGEDEIFGFEINRTVPTGTYTTSLQYKDGRTGRTFTASKTLYIYGWEIALSLNSTYNAGSNISINVQNTGKVDAELTCTGTLYNSSSSQIHQDITDLSLAVDETKTFDVGIPADVDSGAYELQATCTDTIVSGKSESFSDWVNISGMELNITLERYNYTQNEIISVNVTNVGGVDTECNYTLMLFDSRYVLLSQNSSLENISVGDSKTFSLHVPSGIITGAYIVKIEAVDSLTNKSIFAWATINVSGLQATMSVASDERYYFDYENITILTSIENTDGEIDDANLTLKITTAPEWTEFFSYNSITSIAVYETYTLFFGTGSTGEMFEGSAGSGMLKYDKLTGLWTFYDTADGLSSNTVNDIQVDGDILWIATSNGVSKYNILTNTWTIYNISNSGIAYNQIKTIAVDSDSIWFTLASSWQGYGISRYYRNGTWVNYNSSNSGLLNDYINAIAVDDDILWVGSDSGLNAYNKTSDSWTNYTTVNSNISDNYVKAVAINSHPWFGTTKGLVRYDKTNDNWTTFNASNSNLSNNLVSKIFIGEDNEILWISLGDTWSGYGINRYNKTSGVWTYYNTTNSGLISDKVYAFGINTYFWFGTDKGIVKYAELGGTWMAYLNGPIGTSISAIATDDEETWVGFSSPSEGVGRYFKSNGTWISHTTSNSGLLNNYAKAIALSDSYAWLSFDSGCGVSRFNRATGTWKNYTTSNSPLLSDTVNAIAVDNDVVWFGTNAGVSKFDTGSDTWTNYTTSNSGLLNDGITAIDVDGNRIWFGTGSGVSKYNKNNDSFVDSYTTSNSNLPSNTTRSIAIDGTVWVGTDNGLAKYNNVSNTWEVYNTSNSGIRSNNINVIAANSNEVWVAFNEWGLDAINSYAKSTGEWEIFNSTNSILCAGNTPKLATYENEVWIGFGWGCDALYRYTSGGDLSPLYENSSVFDIATNDSNSMNEFVGTLESDGKMSLKATLLSNNSQTISTAENTFYVVEKQTTVTLNTDKEIYVPNETISITGEVKNDAPIDVNDIELVLEANGVLIHSENVDLSANSVNAFSTTFETNSSFNLTAEIHGVSATKEVIVEVPTLNITITTPETFGRWEFSAIVNITNAWSRVVDLTVWVYNETYALTIPANESRQIQKGFNGAELLRNLTFNVTIFGDYNYNTTEEIPFGENVVLNLTTEDSYEEGTITLNYTVQNLGNLASEFNVTFQLGTTTVKQIYLPVNGTLTYELNYNLTQGNYTLFYETPFQSGNTSIRILRYDQLQFNFTKNFTNGSLILSINVSNVGPNEFLGSLKTETDFYTNVTNLTLAVGASEIVLLGIPLGDLQPGTYNVTVKILHDGSTLLQETKYFTAIYEFSIISVPYDITFDLGQNATLNFTVKNLGSAVGEATILFEVPGLHDENGTESLSANQEKNLSFEFFIPDDLEDGNYSATLFVNDVKNRTRFAVRGSSISVNSTLNKFFYEENDTVILTLNVTNLGTINMTNMSSRAKFNDYENSTRFDLAAQESKLITFNFTVSFNGIDDKLFYAVYLSSGRSLYINSKYLTPESPVTIYSSEQVYEMRQNATLFINSTLNGNLTLLSTELSINITMNITNTSLANYTFTVPKIQSGSYAINCTLNYTSGNFSSLYTIDVLGLFATIIDAELNNYSYTSGDNLNIELTVNIEQNLSDGIIINISVYGPEKNLINVSSFNRSVVIGENVLDLNMTLSTNETGIHEIVYQIFADPDNTFIVISSGSRYFDGTPPVEEEEPQAVIYNITLRQGWNLISVPLNISVG